MTGGLTEEGKKQYMEGRDARQEEDDCRRCRDHRDYLLQYSTNVFFVESLIPRLKVDRPNRTLYESKNKCPGRRFA